jgi:hypothetical protein
MDDVELKTTCFEVGSDPEVMKVAEAASHPFCKLEDSVDGLHGGVGQAGFPEGQD